MTDTVTVNRDDLVSILDWASNAAQELIRTGQLKPHEPGPRFMRLRLASIEPDETTRLIDDLRRAVQYAGHVPSYHRRIMARHRAEWPSLWYAIDAILRERS